MNIRPLPQELQTKAEKEINEVPTRIQEDVVLIREWLLQQPHLNARSDDQWLINFLRGCKFSLEKTKAKLDRFYTIKSSLPEFFLNRDPYLPEIQELLSLGIILPLPNASNSSGPWILVVRSVGMDPKKIPIINLIKVFFMIMEILLYEDDQFIISGQHVLYDMKMTNTNYVTQATPSICKKFIICFKEAFPYRLKGVHVLHFPTAYEPILNIAKPLLGKKLASKIKVYSSGNDDRVNDALPLPLLPQNYGGRAESLEELTIKWKNKVESYREWFLKDATYGCDESKRLGKPVTSSDLFGIEGSFRKLTVD